jgi:anti-sigma B factor antagonist
MLNIEKVNNVFVAKFENADRFNALITEQVKEELKGVFTAKGVELVLSLQGIKFIDSSGFGVFLSVMKTAANSQGKLKICCISDEVMELFKLLQLHNVFEIFDTVEECVASFSS